MDTKLTLGEFLKNKVAENVTTKAELAEAAGISVSTIGQILRGSIKRPPMKRLEGFATVLNIDVNILVSLL